MPPSELDGKLNIFLLNLARTWSSSVVGERLRLLQHVTGVS